MLPAVEIKNDKVFLTFKSTNENFTRIRADCISSYTSAYSLTECKPFIEVIVGSERVKMFFATQEKRDEAIKLIELHTITI